MYYLFLIILLFISYCLLFITCFHVFFFLGKISDKEMDILFGHPRALEEIYCIALRYFDQYWEEKGASYMQFTTIMAEVTQQITKTLNECSSLNQFQAKCFHVGKHETSPGAGMKIN